MLVVFLVTRAIGGDKLNSQKGKALPEESKKPEPATIHNGWSRVNA
jgi:hypothetical protein